ncbi:MAG: ferritin family protein [Desulfobacteraceae bacterium]|nr:ferritin family protein [Desulfobacteraceae bacterium]
MNILECTIKMKQETRAHYQQLEKVATDKELKRLFSLMAAAEGEHIDKLIEMKDKMARLNIPGSDKLVESVCVYSPHIDPRHLAEALRNDPDAYRHVVQEEEETIEFFDQLTNQAESEELKRICRLQADKEREHLAVLENIYFFVEEPRTYLEWGEFSNLKSL